MVGIVIVSHSARLAEGVRELAAQMVQDRVPLAVAGGIDDPENPIGTDAMKVFAAIESVYSDDGVVVLLDLGSAILSAELALEFLTPEQAENVVLSAAPLVEGTMAAVIQASVGGTRDQVLAEASLALTAKAAQMPDAEVVETTAVSALLFSSADERSITLIINNRMGLHARPAARFVAAANRFEADIQVFKGAKVANAKSINQVATLGARQGDEVVITARGPQADEALAAFQALADDNFGDVDKPESAVKTAVSQPAIVADGALQGIAASPGIAIGPVVLYRPRLPQIETHTIENPGAEWTRLEKALAAALTEIQTLYAQAVQQVGADEAAIFEAHALVLQDPTLSELVKDRIQNARVNAESAWQSEIDALAQTYSEMEDAYMQARAADIQDVGQRVLRHLLGVEPPSMDFYDPAILIAAELTPSDTARMDPAMVLGICTEQGGATSHSAILARALGIPAIVGLGTAVWHINEGQVIAIDGGQGQVWPQPAAADLAALQMQREQWLAAQAAAKQTSQETAVTQDGHTIEIAANIGSPNDVPIALDFGAEGVGLFRTEFLFMDRESAPDEEEQYHAYREVANAMGQRPVIVRTLDVGGDKPLPYLNLGREENPFLGWRGIRFCLDKPEIFKPQLRAVLRASHGRNLKLMFPMIGSVGEIRAAKALLAEARAELHAAGQLFDDNMEVGIMIEVPSAVAIGDQLAAEVDFFSIGTNDLTQYTMAADRGNANVANLAQALQPAVLRMVQQTVQAAHAAGIWVGMCGELAGNALATPLLVGLGLDELSMSAPAIPAVKAAVRVLTTAEAANVAAAALNLDSATAVIEFLKQV